MFWLLRNLLLRLLRQFETAIIHVNQDSLGENYVVSRSLIQQDAEVLDFLAIDYLLHFLGNKKLTSTQETLTMLDLRLSLIKSEIEHRTATEASDVLKHGKFQVSVFDRSSSSSDTAPDTPGFALSSGVSTWGFDQHESPKSIKHSGDGFPAQMPDFSAHNFPLMLAPEDPGYDSDREGSTVMTIQPSQQTVKQGDPRSPTSNGGDWEQVGSWRKPKTRLDIHHRTTQFLEDTRYHDRAGAFRAIGGTDPRRAPSRPISGIDQKAIQPLPSYGTRIVSIEHAPGYVENINNQSVSRGRISGRSSAEIALTHISKNSPPPARGGGMIMDRRLDKNLEGSPGSTKIRDRFSRTTGDCQCIRRRDTYLKAE